MAVTALFSFHVPRGRITLLWPGFILEKRRHPLPVGGAAAGSVAHQPGARAGHRYP
ncbi:hypothetical protein [Cyanobium sp. Morenito 9A2]|uniref:hypothetical protein n=1 Tax=Cyanobium sp. Morenito 9A2 TaxID=2823718 RepID=UPI0020CEC796|nr:hypothetical protein [Cyanobium sp. Morenito 9A2]